MQQLTAALKLRHLHDFAYRFSVPQGFIFSSGKPSTSALHPDAKMQIEGQSCTGKDGGAQVKVHELLVCGKLWCVTLSLLRVHHVMEEPALFSGKII